MAGEVKIKIEVVGDQEATNRIDKVSKAVGSTSQGGSLIGSIFKANIATAAFVKGFEIMVDVLKTVPNEILNAAKSLEQYELQLTALFDTEAEAKAFGTAINDIAWSIPGQSEDTVKAYGKALLVAGYSGSDTIDIIKRLGDVTAIVGADKMDLFVSAFTKVQQTGKLLPRDLIALSRAGLNLNEAFGLNVDTLSELDFKEISISAEDLQAALTKVTEEEGKYAGATEKFFNTMIGKEQSMTGTIDDFYETLSQSLKPALQDVYTWLSKLVTIITTRLLAIFNRLAANPAVVTFFQNLWNTIKVLAEFILNTAISAFDWLAGVFEDIAPSLNELWTSLQELAKVLIGLFDSDAIAEIGDDLTQTFTQFLISNIQTLTGWVKTLIDYFKSPEGKKAIEDFKDNLKKTKDVIDGLTDAFDFLHSSSKAVTDFLGSDSVAGNILKGVGSFMAFMNPLTRITEGLQAVIRETKTLLYMMGLLEAQPVVQGSNLGTQAGWKQQRTEGGGRRHDGGIIPYVAGGNVPIIAQSGEYVIPRKIVDEIKGGNTYNNKSNTININVQGGMNRSQAMDTGFLFQNLLARA